MASPVLNKDSLPDHPESPDKKDQEGSPASKPGSPVSVNSSPERVQSPNPETCPICLASLQNRSFTDNCYHEFCFPCLLEWSKHKQECPLCKAPFKCIVHNLRSYDDYDLYLLDDPETQQSQNREARHRSFRYRTTMTLQRVLAQQQRQLQRQLDRLRRPTGRVTGATSQHDAINSSSEFRRRVYTEGLHVSRVRNMKSKTRTITPDYLSENPACCHRFVPWLNRELNALLGPDATNIQFILELLIDLVKRFEVTSQEIYEHISPFIGNNTRHFQKEFYSFAVSPYCMQAYDQHVIYEQLPHEIASSSDDEYNMPSTSAAAQGSSVIVISPQRNGNLTPTVIINDEDGQNSPQEFQVIDESSCDPPVLTTSSSPNVTVVATSPQVAASSSDRKETVASSSDRKETVEQEPVPMETTTAASGWESPTPGPSYEAPGPSYEAPGPSYEVIMIGPSRKKIDCRIKKERCSSFDSSDSEKSGEVMIVGFQKPWRARTPVFLSSASDDLSSGPCTPIRRRRKKSQSGSPSSKKQRRGRSRRSRSDSRPADLSRLQFRSRSGSRSRYIRRSTSPSRGRYGYRGRQRSNSIERYRAEICRRRSRSRESRRRKSISPDVNPYRFRYVQENTREDRRGHRSRSRSKYSPKRPKKRSRRDSDSSTHSSKTKSKKKSKKSNKSKSNLSSSSSSSDDPTRLIERYRARKKQAEAAENKEKEDKSKEKDKKKGKDKEKNRDKDKGRDKEKDKYREDREKCRYREDRDERYKDERYREERVERYREEPMDRYREERMDRYRDDREMRYREEDRYRGAREARYREEMEERYREDRHRERDDRYREELAERPREDRYREDERESARDYYREKIQERRDTSRERDRKERDPSRERDRGREKDKHKKHKSSRESHAYFCSGMVLDDPSSILQKHDSGFPVDWARKFMEERIHPIHGESSSPVKNRPIQLQLIDKYWNCLSDRQRKMMGCKLIQDASSLELAIVSRHRTSDESDKMFCLDKSAIGLGYQASMLDSIMEQRLLKEYASLPGKSNKQPSLEIQSNEVVVVSSTSEVECVNNERLMKKTSKASPDVTFLKEELGEQPSVSAMLSVFPPSLFSRSMWTMQRLFPDYGVSSGFLSLSDNSSDVEIVPAPCPNPVVISSDSSDRTVDYYF